MEMVQTIRQLGCVQKMSARQIAKTLQVSRNTVRRYLRGAEVGVRRTPARDRPVFEKIRQRATELLESSGQWTAGKQQLTASRLHEMLRSEGFSVGRTLVKQVFREWKRKKAEVYIPLEYRPGDLGEVDFFEVLYRIRGEQRKGYMFVMRLMFAGFDFARIYERQDQISFLDGHVRAFAYFGGMPARLLYDNLKPAVARILVGWQRQLTERFLALVTHYGYEACFARPGTGHDKGGVESRGRSIRLHHLVPIPEGESLEEINTALLHGIEKRYGSNAKLQEEREHFRPLPARPFEPASVRDALVSRRGLVKVDGAEYSVCERWVSLHVQVSVQPEQVVITGPDGTVTHPRLRSGEKIVDYRHFLRELSRKPNAIRQISPSLLRDLGEPFGTVWTALAKEHGEEGAARQFAAILRLVNAQGLEPIRQRIVSGMERGRPVLLSLVPQEPASDSSLPQQYADMRVESAHASDFDSLMQVGGSR